MSKPKVYLNSREWDREHQDRRIKKAQKIQGLRDLLEAWEANPEVDHAYILELRAKLRQAQNQLDAMKP